MHGLPCTAFATLTSMLLFDGLGLVATGYSGRKIVGMVADKGAAKPVQPE